MDTEELDDLFGRIALEKEYITEDELKDSLDARRHLRELGITDRTLADIMEQKGFVSEFEKDEILLQLEKGTASGTTIHGYQVLLELAHDKPGRLYKGYQRAMDRTVLLRVLSKSDPAEAELIPALKREAKLVARLQHPGIVVGYDAGETDEEYFLVSEFVEGIRLSQLIELEGSLGEQEALKIALRVARALEYLDEQGVVHRDIEPENILVSKSGESKIANFVLAVRENEVGGAAGENTQTATPFYLSPEQAKGFADLDVRSDLFSLGSTLYHMFTGHFPFGSDAEMAMAHIITKETPDPRTLVPEISQLAAELVLKLMQKEKENRYQSATDVRKRMEEILSVEVSPGAAAKPRKSARSRRQRVKRASRMFQAQAATPLRPAPPPVAPLPSVPAPPRPEPAAPAHAGVPRPKPESVRPRSAAVTAAKTSSSNTAIFAIIGMVVALIVIIAVISSLSSGGRRTTGASPVRMPVPGVGPLPGGIVEPGPGSQRVSDVVGQAALSAEQKELRKLRALQAEFPDSPEVIAKYEEFLAKAKDPELRKFATDARKAMVSNFYNTVQDQGKKLRDAHRYAAALEQYEKLLSLIPETQKSALQGTRAQIDQTRAEADIHYTQQSSRAEGLFDRGDIEGAIAIYEKLARDSLGEHAEIARKIVAQRGLKVPRPPPGPREHPPGPGPELKTPEEIEAEERKKKAEAKLRAMKQRIVAELQAQVAEHIRGMRIEAASRLVRKALEQKKDPAIIEGVKQIEKHLNMVEKSLKALEAHMDHLYKQNIVQLYLKKRQVLLGELVKYERGILIFKKRNNETVQVRLTDILDVEVERYLLEGFGDKSAATLLNMAVFFVYYYGNNELTRKYLGLAQAAGADVKEYLDLLRGASFEAALMAAEEDLRRKKYFSAYMRLCKLRDDFSQTEAFKQRKEYVEEITKQAYTSSGLKRLFVGKLKAIPPLFEAFYDFAHSSQLNDFSARAWDAKGAKLQSEVWSLEDNMLAGSGEGALIWSGQAKDELALSFFVEPIETGPFEVLLFADPSKLYSGRAYAFGFSATIDEGENAEPEHYIALWDGRKGQYKYLKRGIMKPELDEKKTYHVQIIARHNTLQLFVNKKLLGEVKDSTLGGGTVVLRVNGSLVRFDNLTIKAKFDESWLRKAAKSAK